MRFLARRYDTHELAVVKSTASGFCALRSVAPQQVTTTPVPWVAPGLVDIQVNGYGGQEFSSLDLTPEQVATIVRQHFAFGVTRFCPTLTTQSFECSPTACGRSTGRARDSPTSRGPSPAFTSKDRTSRPKMARGAHPQEHCRRPDWEEFQRLQDAAGGRIGILTMSAEFDESADFIAQVVTSGVTSPSVTPGPRRADSRGGRRRAR